MVALLVPAAGSSATTIGQVGDPTGTGCGTSQLATQEGVTSGPDYVVPPGGGVITSWRFQSGAEFPGSTAKFKVLEIGPLATASVRWYKVLAETESHPIELSKVNEFPARITVHGGELIGVGVYNSGGFAPCQFAGVLAGNTVRYAVPDPALSTWTQFFPRTGRADVEATLEPDADHDGYGDETQDKCLGNVAHEDCTPPPPGSAFEIGSLSRLPAGWALLTLDVPQAGTATVRATARVAPAAAVKRRRITVAKGRAAPTGAERVVLVLKPTRKARRVLARRHRLRARFTIAFTPAAGIPTKQVRSLTLKR